MKPTNLQERNLRGAIFYNYGVKEDLSKCKIEGENGTWAIIRNEKSPVSGYLICREMEALIAAQKRLRESGAATSPHLYDVNSNLHLLTFIQRSRDVVVYNG